MQLIVHINFADDWIWTADLWCRKQPLFQLCHNHFPELQRVGNYFLFLKRMRKDIQRKRKNIQRERKRKLGSLRERELLWFYRREWIERLVNGKAKKLLKLNLKSSSVWPDGSIFYLYLGINNDENLRQNKFWQNSFKIMPNYPFKSLPGIINLWLKRQNIAKSRHTLVIGANEKFVTFMNWNLGSKIR